MEISANSTRNRIVAFTKRGNHERGLIKGSSAVMITSTVICRTRRKLFALRCRFRAVCLQHVTLLIPRFQSTHGFRPRPFLWSISDRISLSLLQPVNYCCWALPRHSGSDLLTSSNDDDDDDDDCCYYYYYYYYLLLLLLLLLILFLWWTTLCFWSSLFNEENTCFGCEIIHLSCTMTNKLKNENMQ